jgi:hypothetical protein
VVDDQVFPAEFLARLRADLNGNFGSRTCKTSMGQVHDLWFTFKFKQVSSMSEVEKFSYYWDQITTFMRRDSSGAIRLIVCLDCPNSLDFQQSLGSDELKDQGMTHVALLDHIINLYDTSVWDLRNWVRSAELVRPCRAAMLHGC